jgi:hypothetical protein
MHIMLIAVPFTIFLYQFARAKITKYHRLGGLNIRNVFFSVLEAGNLRSRHWQSWFLPRPLL